MDRRRQIRMSEAELAAFLDAQRTLTCATLGPTGRPHLAALWYLPVDGRLDCWTYAASQKARNLEHDPRATLLTEAGTAYQELRGGSSLGVRRRAGPRPRPGAGHGRRPGRPLRRPPRPRAARRPRPPGRQTGRAPPLP